MKSLLHGDCRQLLSTIDAGRYTACVTDPPYHLTSIVKRFGGANAAPCQEGTDGAYARASRGFMGKEWDGGDIAFDPSFWAEVYRVLKPGAHLLAFGGTRTYHRMACAIEDAGFEIRDTLMYCYASGFPKSHSVSKGIDNLNGDARSVIGSASNYGASKLEDGKTAFGDYAGKWDITSSASSASSAWDGWGTALKPAIEPIVFARKRLAESSVARNVLAYGTGAINIDACRIGTTDNLAGGDSTTGNFLSSEGWDRPWEHDPDMAAAKQTRAADNVKRAESLGRWPSNLILSCHCDTPHDADCPVAILNAQSGVSTSGFIAAGTEREGIGYGGGLGSTARNDTIGDSGGASRFYFVAKPSRREKGERNIHPTVKPVELMKYLCRLVCPPGGTILDPFMGSGTTGIGASLGGFDFVGIEREADYFRIAEMRNGLWREYEDLPDAVRSQSSLFDMEDA